MQEKTGLFPLCLNIGGAMPGAPLFKTHLMIYTPAERVTGYGEITQAVNPPLHIDTQLEGNYTYMTVMPKNVHILVILTGHIPIKWPSGGGIGPVIPANVEIRMVLEENWQSGTANYKFMDNDGKWHEIKDAPVKSFPCFK